MTTPLHGTVNYNPKTKKENAYAELNSELEEIWKKVVKGDILNKMDICLNQKYYVYDGCKPIIKNLFIDACSYHTDNDEDVTISDFIKKINQNPTLIDQFITKKYDELKSKLKTAGSRKIRKRMSKKNKKPKRKSKSIKRKKY